ncbi:MAG: hypothetical protein CMJ19_25075 [Phycisphaeraceae bacterium]|nr:hypothetical protein [Phycisphaeraceae bacterium]
MNELIQKAFSYVDYIVKPPLQELGGILADNVKFLRYKNQVRLINKTQEFHEKKGIKPKQIPIKTFYEILESSSLEENETLQDMWAALLANATDMDSRTDFSEVFVKILSELSQEEALFLYARWTEFKKTPDATIMIIHVNDVIRSLGHEPDDSTAEKSGDKLKADVILNNLERLGIIKESSTHPKFSLRNYRVTHLGMLFLEKCNYNV